MAPPGAGRADAARRRRLAPHGSQLVSHAGSRRVRNEHDARGMPQQRSRTMQSPWMTMSARRINHAPAKVSNLSQDELASHQAAYETTSIS